MGIEEWEDVLNQDITVEPFMGHDVFGERSYGASVAYKARVSGKIKLVRDETGAERVANHTVYVMTTVHFSPKDRITLPLGYSPSQPLIVSTAVVPDEDGMHHSVIYLQ